MSLPKKLIYNLGILTSILLIAACSTTYNVNEIPQGAPLVVKGEHIVGVSAIGEWCPLFSPDTPQVECTGLPPGEYQINATTQTVTLLGTKQEKEIVPYDPADDLCKQKNIQNCSPNYIMHANKIPDDPLYPQLWGLEQSRTKEAWDTVNKSPSVRVAVIDSGVQCDHPDLGNCVAQFDAITGKEVQTDENGHGTHVAGTISSVGNNSSGTVGVTWECQILAAKFLGSTGGGNLFDAIKAIDWSIQNGAQLINASWGCRRCYSEPLRAAIARARDAGILFVAAAGNNGVNNDGIPHYPSDYDLDNILSVAAIDEDERLAGFSNYSSKSVDLAAPGVSILSTWPTDGYRSISGTSMAAPHVTGAAALLLSTGLDGRTTRTKLLTSARNLESLTGKVLTEGSLDVGQAVSTSEPDPTPPPCKPERLQACKKQCRVAYKCRYFKQRKCRGICEEEWCRDA